MEKTTNNGRAKANEIADGLERDLPGLRSLTSNSGAVAMAVSGALVPKLEEAIAFMRGVARESE